MNTIIEKIRAEIERRIDIIKPKPGQGFILCEQITKQLKDLLSFLSDLEKEEKPIEGLEEEISRYLREECSNDDEPSISEVARHFAKWGAEHAKKYGKVK